MQLNNEAEEKYADYEKRRQKGRKIEMRGVRRAFEPWDEIFTWELGRGRTELVCEDCFDGLFGELSRRERAELIGSRVTTAEELGVK
jgi:hypothetical protein